MLDLIGLRSFVHVCERGTVAAAANTLGYTAPAVSQHIAKLERDLGAPVFDRIGGRLSPNARGVELLEIAGHMLDLAEQCQQVATKSPGPTPVTIAGFASAITAVISPALPLLTSFRISVVGADGDEALRQLRLGQVDIALIQRYDHDDFAADQRLTYREVTRDDLRIVLPPDHPARTRLDQLGAAHWLLNGADTQCTNSVLALLHAEGIEPDVRASLDDNHALLALVSAGFGVCIVPELVLSEIGSSVRTTVAAQRLHASRSIYAVTRRSGDRAHTDVAATLATSRH